MDLLGIWLARPRSPDAIGFCRRVRRTRRSVSPAQLPLAACRIALRAPTAAAALADDRDRLCHAVRHRLRAVAPATGRLRARRWLARLLRVADRWAGCLHDGAIGPEHLLMALCQEPAVAAALARAGVRPCELLRAQAARRGLDPAALGGRLWPFFSRVPLRPEALRHLPAEDASAIADTHNGLRPAERLELPHVRYALARGPVTRPEFVALVAEYFGRRGGAEGCGAPVPRPDAPPRDGRHVALRSPCG